MGAETIESIIENLSNRLDKICADAKETADRISIIDSKIEIAYDNDVIDSLTIEREICSNKINMLNHERARIVAEINCF